DFSRERSSHVQTCPAIPAVIAAVDRKLPLVSGPHCQLWPSSFVAAKMDTWWTARPRTSEFFLSPTLLWLSRPGPRLRSSWRILALISPSFVHPPIHARDNAS